MKVLHISEHYAPVGGAETYLLRTLDELDRRGHHNIVLYRREHERTPHDGRIAYHVPRSNAAGAHGIAGAQKVIRDENPDIICLHLVYDPAIVELAASFKPTVAYMHNMHSCCPGLAKYFRRTDTICKRPFRVTGCTLNIYLRRCASARHPRSVYRIIRRATLQQRAYRQVDELLAASVFMKDLLIQNGFDARNIELLPYFIDAPAKEEKAGQKGEELPLILYVGRLELEKGIPYLLKAMPLVKTPCRLVLAGDGTRRERYEALVHRFRIEDRVTFAGWLSRASLAELYGKSALLAFPSIWPEPFGLTGPEAMAFGTPVVAFAVGGVLDWLEDGQNGFSVEPKNWMQLAEKIDILLRDRSLARRMGEYGRQRVTQKYSVDLHIERLMRVFDKVA